jgi:hypothetical protein
MPLLLNQLIELALADDDRIELVSNLRDPRALTAVADSECADVLIVGGDELEDAEITRLVAAHRCLRVLSVHDDGRSSFMHSLDRGKVPLGELSPTQLIEVVTAP